MFSYFCWGPGARACLSQLTKTRQHGGEKVAAIFRAQEPPCRLLWFDFNCTNFTSWITHIVFSIWISFHLIGSWFYCLGCCACVHCRNHILYYISMELANRIIGNTSLCLYSGLVVVSKDSDLNELLKWSILTKCVYVCVCVCWASRFWCASLCGWWHAFENLC